LSSIFFCLGAFVLAPSTLYNCDNLPLGCLFPFFYCCASWGHSPCATILLHFSLYRVYQLLFLSSSLFYLNVWAFPFTVPYSPTSKAFYFFCLLPSNISLSSFPTFYYPACKYFKFILGFPSFLFLFSIPAVTGQVPKLFATPTFSFSSSL